LKTPYLRFSLRTD